MGREGNRQPGAGLHHHPRSEGCGHPHPGEELRHSAALWKLARQAQAISIEFPVKAGGTRTVVFETGGVDASQMPWK